MGKYYYDTSEPKKCIKCRCKKLKEVVVDTLDGHTIMEMKIVCSSCGTMVGYWAYGYYEPCFNPAFRNYEL